MRFRLRFGDRAIDDFRETLPVFEVAGQSTLPSFVSVKTDLRG
jgi:hypothetical protein